MLRRPRTWLILLALWAVTLFILSHQSNLFPPGPDIPNIDKVEHAAYFTIGGTVFFLWLRARRPAMSFLATAACTIVFCSVIGALDELHQWFVPNRNGLDRGDWIADTLGGVFGTLLGQWIMPRMLGIVRGRPA